MHPDFKVIKNVYTAALLLLLLSGLSYASPVGTFIYPRCRDILARAYSRRKVQIEAQLDPKNQYYMLLAIGEAKKAQAPFGAILISRRSGETVATGYNQCEKHPIYHAEMMAIRNARYGNHDLDWNDLVLYTTAEPCPMCQSAIGWVGICTVYYGSSIPFLAKQGFAQIEIRSAEIARRTRFRAIQIVGGILERECNLLYKKK